MNLDLLDKEQILLKRLNRGEEMAFDYFFHRYYPLMTTFSKRFLSDSISAEELVQDVFYKVWEKRSDFHDVRSLKAFLYKATRNASFNEISKTQNRYKHQEAYSLNEEQSENSVLSEIVRTEVYASLTEAIRTLPDQCSKIIQMLFEEEMKPSEIATELGIAISTVNSQKARGLTLLKERLKGKDLDFLAMLILFSLKN